MKLTYHYLQIREFCSIKKLVVQLDRPPGLWFLFGNNKIEPSLQSNDCGKSTILNAWCWSMFGKCAERALRNPAIVPWDGGSPEVTLQFNIDGEQHRIVRGANPNFLAMDGREVAQDAIEQLLGLNYDTFLHTVLWPQDQPLFLDLPPTEQLDLFSDALNLNRWDERAEAANIFAKKLDAANAVAKAAIDAVAKQFAEVKTMHEGAKVRADAWESEQAQLEKQAAKELEEVNKFLTNVQRKHDEAALAYDGAGVELAPLRRQVRQLTDYQRVQEYALFKATAAQSTAMERRKQAKRELIEVKAGRCPTCKQPWHNQRHAQKLQDEIDALADAVSDGPVAVAKQAVDDVKRQLQVATEAEGTFAQQESAARLTLDAVTPQLAELKSKARRLTEQREVNDRRGNPFSEQLRELKARRVALAGEHKDKTVAWKADCAKQARYAYWAKAFKDIKLFIIEELLTELKLYSDAVLAQVGLGDWALQFAVEAETKKGTTKRGLNVFVKSPRNSKPVPWQSWGGGVRHRLRIAASLALSEVLLARAGVESSVEALDEPTRSLSSRGVQDVIECLHERARATGRIILFCDHHSIPSDRFRGVLTVERTPAGTNLVETR